MTRLVHRSSLLSLALLLGCGDDGSPAAEGGTAIPATGTGTTGESGTSTGTGPGPVDGSGSTGGGTTTGSVDPSATTGEDGSTTGEAEDLDMSPEDFVCLLEWDRVRRFRITNLLGYLDETLEVANSPTGGVYPVGTVIQLIPNEAMVKRAGGWSPETGDWEFFSLATSAMGTEILDRGATEVVNAFGGNCFDCHSAADPQWDFVCEQDHGCAPIPIDEATIDALQQNDPRCR